MENGLADRRKTFAHGAGVAHFIASFGFTVAALIAYSCHSREVTEHFFSLFGTLYATTAVLAFATLVVSIYRTPRAEIRLRTRPFVWIIAAQAAFIVQSMSAYFLLIHR